MYNDYVMVLTIFLKKIETYRNSEKYGIIHVQYTDE